MTGQAWRSYTSPRAPLFVAQEIKRALSGEDFVAPVALSLRGLGLDAARFQALEAAGFFAQVATLEVTGSFGLSHLEEVALACPRLEALALLQLPASWRPDWSGQVRLTQLRLPRVTQEVVEAGLLRGCRALSLELHGDSAPSLPTLEPLEALHLHLWEPSTRWISWLRGHTGLHSLKISQWRGLPSAWHEALHLPQLHTLSCPELPPDWGQRFPALRRLETSWSPGWEPDSASLQELRLRVAPPQEQAALAWMASHAPRRLHLQGGAWGEGFLRLLRDTAITELGLARCTLRDAEGFAQWLNASSLRQLHMQRCHLPGQPILSPPGSLTRLSLLEPPDPLLLDLSAQGELEHLTLHLGPQHSLELDLSQASALKTLRLLDHEELQPKRLDGLQESLEELTLEPVDHLTATLEERRQRWTAWLTQKPWPHLMTLRCRELLHFSDIAPPLLRGHLPRLNHLDCEGEPQDLATYLSAPSPQPLAAWHLASASPKELLALQHEQGLWPVMTPYKSFSTSPQSAW